MHQRGNHPFAGTATRRRQRGVYALEWAVIFVVFFALLYAIVSFGLGFLVRESMQWAAEDSARAALQHQSGREMRKQHAKSVVRSSLSWLPKDLLQTLDEGDNFSFRICRLNEAATCTEDMDPGAITCNQQASNACMLQVRIKLPYARHSFTPSITMGLMELAMPDLRAQAQILVDHQEF